MNLSKNILDITLNEILADEVVTQETKDRLKELVDSNNTKEIERLILNNLVFFAKYSVIKEIYNNPTYINSCLSFMKTSNFNTTAQLLSRLSETIDLEKFLNQEVFIDEFLKDTELLSILGRIHGFFDNFHNPVRGKLINSFLQKEELNIFILQILPHDVVEELLKDDMYKELIYHVILSKIVEGFLSITDSYLEEKVWETYQERIALLSLKNKIDYFKNISNESLKNRVFETLKLDENIDNVFSYDLKYFLPYLDQDMLFDKCNTNNTKIIDKFLEYLDTEHQIKIIYELDKLGIKLYQYWYNLNSDTKTYIFDNHRQSLDNNQIYSLYQSTKNISCLEELKNRFIESDDLMVNVLYEDDFVELLTEEEKKIFESKIPVEGYIKPPHDTVKLNNYFFDIVKAKNIDYLRKNLDTKVFTSIDDLIKYFTISEQIEIIKHKDLNWLNEILFDDEKFNFFVNILHHNPNFLNGKDLSNLKIGYANDKLINRLDEILPYFSEEQLCIFFNYNIINNNSKIMGLFKNTIPNNPNLLPSLSLLEYFDLEKRKELLKNMNIEHLNNIMNGDYLQKNNYIIDILYERFNEYIDYVNKPKIAVYTDVNNVYLLLEDTKRKELVSKITNITTLERLLFELQKKQLYSDCKQVLDSIISNYEGMTNINFDKELFLHYYDSNDTKYFINNSTLSSIIYTTTYYNNKDIVNEIMKRIKNDSTLLIDEELLSHFNNFMFKLDQDNKDYISNEINKLINNNSLYNSEYKDKLPNISCAEKLRFLCLYNQGILQGNKKDIFDRLLEKNPFILNSINSIVFDDNILSLGEAFVEKLSKYPNMERQIKKLNSINPAIVKFLSQAGNYLLSNNISQLSFDKEISMIIEYLSSPKSKLKDYDFGIVNEQSIEDVVNYILYEYENLIVVYNPSYTLYPTINELYNLSIDDFTNERLKKCDEKFNNSINIEDKKNMYFNKYLSMSLSDARNFYKSYVVNYSKVMKYAESDLPIKFIELISKIIDIEDSINIEELYNTTTISYSMSDRFTIEEIMQKAYFESLTHDYIDKQKGTQVTKQFKDKEGNLVSLPMTELIDNFGIIVHSTCAYGEMTLLDNDYFTSWNNNPNTENHGICCSYITNSSYGTAAVTGTGVMFGFNKLNNTSVSTYSPYDLASRNYGFNINCTHIPYYTTLDDIPDYTRHTHNEVNLERRNYSIDPRFASVQPNCIIIFEDMDDNIKANSIKAYQDFKKHGIELELIYIDRVKVARNESCKLDDMTKEYLSTYDLNILKDIINKYESNICGCDFIGMGKQQSLNLFNQNELFKTDSIKKLIFDTIEYIKNIGDVSERNNKITTFINIIDEEQYKFDLLDDFNKDRAHKFELNDENLKRQLDVLRSMIDDTNLTDKKVL